MSSTEDDMEKNNNGKQASEATINFVANMFDLIYLAGTFILNKSQFTPVSR
ncbi:MAG: hypothetical protein MUO26_13935 [Methanotrichaceae archaeon]|nr:hypothetical protein [Methanotrichaceae archaeon]